MSEGKEILTIINILERVLSDDEGEVLNSSRLAKVKMAKLGMTRMRDLINRCMSDAVSRHSTGPHPEQHATQQDEKPEPKTKAKQDRSDRMYADFAFRIFNHPDFDDRLNDWQKDAVENWTTWRRSFSSKQRAKLSEIGEVLGIRIDDDDEEAPVRKPSPHERDERDRQHHFRTI